MTAKAAAPRAKALVYAEDELGVHKAYEAAREARSNLDAALTELAERKDQRRFIEEAISARELEIISDEHGKHSGMSVAAMERHLKMELPKDDNLRDLHSSLNKCVSDIEGLEFDIRVHDADIKIAVARMTELGGYLNYLAAVKQSGKPSTPEKPEKPE